MLKGSDTMYDPLDRHGNVTTFYYSDIDEVEELKSRIKILEEENKVLQRQKDYVNIVIDIFEDTQKKMFMGGKLYHVRSIADDILFINSEYRMDANMMATLQKHLDGRILCSSVKGDVLVILCGVRHFE